MAWQGTEAPKKKKKNDPISGCTVLLIKKNESNYYQKLLEIEKRLCVRLHSGDKHQLRKWVCRSKSTNQEGVRSAHRTDLCFSICRFSQVVFIPRVQPHAQSLFFLKLFPIVFGNNCNMDQKKKKELMFLGQAGLFLYFQAGYSSATRSSTSDLTVHLWVQDKLRKTSVCTIR